MKTLIDWLIKLVRGLIYDRFFIVLSFFADIYCLYPYLPVVKQAQKLNRATQHEFG